MSVTEGKGHSKFIPFHAPSRCTSYLESAAQSRTSRYRSSLAEQSESNSSGTTVYVLPGSRDRFSSVSSHARVGHAVSQVDI